MLATNSEYVSVLTIHIIFLKILSFSTMLLKQSLHVNLFQIC